MKKFQIFLKIFLKYKNKQVRVYNYYQINSYFINNVRIVSSYWSCLLKKISEQYKHLFENSLILCVKCVYFYFFFKSSLFF